MPTNKAPDRCAPTHTLIITLSFLVLFSPFTAFGQTTPAQTPAPAATPRPQRPADEEALAKASSIKDPQERVEALIKYVSDFPRAPYIRNAAFYLTRGLKPMYSEPEKVRPLLNRFVEGVSTATVYARSEFYYNISKDLLNSGILFDLAEELARKSVAILDENAYITNERAGHDARQSYYTARDPKYKVEAFSAAQAAEKFRTFRALNHATLGRAYLKRGNVVEAEKALKQAQTIAPSMEAGTALADLLEQRGKTAEALEYMGAAALTGRLTAAGVTRLHELYRKLNNGNLDGLEASLDARYRKSFRAPIKVEHYRPSTSRPSGSAARSVLAEFITGAGCEPCVSVDLSFDAVLERYSRQDVVLLVYHMHAPTSDPLSNHSAQARTKYYGANGAPTVFLDGVNLKPGEGLRTETEGVFRNLDAAIGSRLESPAKAQIKVDASLEGNALKVAAVVDGIRTSSTDLKVQLALVEQHVSYSGENGLRFHPMVVRNVGRATDGGYGFAISGTTAGKVEHIFDLNQIAAENLKYYDDYIADMKKRLGPGFEVSFKEKRYLIDREKLAVVAFVQDDKTKEVLQAAFLKIAPVGEKRSK